LAVNLHERDPEVMVNAINGASSTISSCAEARTLSRSVGTNVSCAFASNSSILGLVK
jgi:hypothetical protein